MDGRCKYINLCEISINCITAKISRLKKIEIPLTPLAVTPNAARYMGVLVVTTNATRGQIHGGASGNAERNSRPDIWWC